jgi:hypothetical protein
VFKLFYIFCLLIFILQFYPVSAQITPFGLDSSNITALSISENRAGMSHILLAGTDSNGVFSYQPEIKKSQWVKMGLEDYNVSDVFVQTVGVGPLDFYLLYAAVKPGEDIKTPHLIYKKDLRINTVEWIPADSGLIAQGTSAVTGLTGFHFSGHEPPEPLFCIFGGDIYRSYQFSDQPWDSIASFGGLVSLKSFSDSILWGGGTTIGFAPFLVKSTDKGEHWDELFPDPNIVGGDNTCHSVAINPQNPDTVYAALWGRIIKSTDGGKNWKETGLTDTKFAFFSILFNPINSNHLVTGGSDENDHFLFFESTDGGDKWTRVEPLTMQPAPIAKITSMAGQIVNDEFCVFIGTAGNGVYKYTRIPSALKTDVLKRLPVQAALAQNYPNPFNPTTAIPYTLNQASHIRISVFNTNGELVAKLFDGNKSAGNHSVTWNAKNLASGIYIVSLADGNNISMRKMLLMK